MDLFNTSTTTNLLPYDGEAIYLGRVLDHERAQYYLDRLLSDIAWKPDEAIVYGKHYVTKRKAAWYGDERYAYTYSNTTKYALPWTTELLELRSVVEGNAGMRFNSCLLNLYSSGDEGMAWHSDDEESLGRNTTIASLSFGAERKFSFRHKASGHTVSVVLEHGSLLIMRGATQTHWQHCLPKTKKVRKARVNLTFRTMVG